MFDILGAGDGASFTLAGKNDLLEGTQEIAIEAIRSRPSTSIDLASLGIIDHVVAEPVATPLMLSTCR